MTNNEYREHEGISSTEIKNMAKSMAYYKYCKDNPGDKDSVSLLFGRAYHKYCLEPDTFYDEFAIAPYCDRRPEKFSPNTSSTGCLPRLSRRSSALPWND